MLHGGEKKFRPEETSKMEETACQVNRCYILLTKAELERATNHTRSSRDPALKELVLADVDGVEKKFFVFAHPSKPWRELSLSCKTGEAHDLHLMVPSGQLHEEQGHRVWQSSQERRVKDAALDSLMHSSAVQTVVTLEHYKEKLRKKLFADHKDEGGGEDEDGDEEEDAEAASEPRRLLALKNESEEEASGGSAALARQSSALMGYGAGTSSSKDSLTSSSRKLRRRPQFNLSPQAPDRAATLDLEEAEEKVLTSKQPPSEALLQTADQYLTDEQIVIKWTWKLPLDELLEGDKKFGVIKNHALNAVKKIAPTYKNLLNGHLALVQAAMSLAPHEIGAQSEKDIHDAVTLLDPHVPRWPVPIQVTLWSMHAVGLVRAVLTNGLEQQFAEFMAFCSPYMVGVGPATSLLRPALVEVEVEEAEKIQMFSEKLVQSIIVPTIGAGEQGFGSLKTMMAYLKQKLAQDSFAELTDEVVTEISDLLDVAKTVEAVTADDPYKVLFLTSAVDRIRKEFKVVGSKAVTLIANAFSESSYWVDLISTFVQVTSKMALHQCKLEEVQKYVDEEAKELELNDDERCKLIMSVIKELQYLQEEIQVNYLQHLVRAVAARVKGYWASIKQKIDLMTFQGDLQQVQELLKEASLTFSGDATVSTFMAELMELMVQRSGEERMTKMLDGLKEMAKVVQQGVPKVEVLNDFLDTAVQAMGVDIPAPQQSTFNDIMEGMVRQQLVCLESEQLDGAQSIALLVATMDPWTLEVFKSHSKQPAVMVMELLSATKQFKGDAADVQKMLDQDKGNEALAGLIRMLAKAKAMQVEETHAASQLMTKAIAAAQSLHDKAKEVKLDKEKTLVKVEQDALKSIAGGMQDGKHWTAGAGDLSTWASLQRRASQTVCEMNAKEMVLKMQRLEKAMLRVKEKGHIEHVLLECYSGCLGGGVVGANTHWS